MSVQGTPLPAGTQVGEYVIQRPLDQDDYGIHYRAQHPVQGTVLLHELFAPEFVRRGPDGIEAEAIETEDRVALRWWTRNYLERARQFAAIRHPALLPILAVFEAHGTAWHASPSIPAVSLHSLLMRQAVLDPPRADRLLAGLLDALAALREAHLLHRALTPQQVWVQDDGGGVIGGFGSLRAPLRFRSRLLHSVMPAPYAAPEEQRADATPTPATDLYAAAALVYHAIAGQPPPAAELRMEGALLPSLASLAPGRVSESTAAAIESAMALDPAVRWLGVEQWRGARQAPAPQVSAAPHMSPSRVRPPAWLLGGVPALLLVIGLAGWWGLRTGPEPVSAVAQLAAVDPVRAPAGTAPASANPAVAGEDDEPSAAFEPAAVDARASAAERSASDRTAVEPTAIEPTAIEPSPGPAPLDVAARPTLALAPVATVAPTPRRTAAAVVAEPTERPAPATPAPQATALALTGARPAGLEVASLQPPAAESVDPAALARAEEERRRRDHAQQLALERSRCTRHVSELFDGRDFTYADIAKFEDVVPLADGRLQTPPIRTDDGRRFAFLIDNNGCVVRMLR